MTKKTSSSFTICHIFALEINHVPVLLTVRALLARSPKRNKRKVVSGSRVTLPENFACNPELSFNPLARVTLAVGLPYLLVNRALESLMIIPRKKFIISTERAFLRYKHVPIFLRDRRFSYNTRPLKHEFCFNY